MRLTSHHSSQLILHAVASCTTYLTAVALCFVLCTPCNAQHSIVYLAGTVQGRPGPGAEGVKPEHQAHLHLLLMLQAQIYGAAFNVVCCKLQVRYRADLDLVLKGLSLSILFSC